MKVYYKYNPEEEPEPMNGCIFCRYEKRGSYSPDVRKPIQHHINGSKTDRWGNKSGRTIPLCGCHHGRIHKFYSKKAIDEALKINPKFYEETTLEYLRIIKGKKLL